MKNIIQNIVYIVTTGVLVGLATFGGAVRFAYAETSVAGGVLRQSTVWDAAGSPYVLRDTLIIPAGITLTMNKGTEVRTDPLADQAGDYPYIRVEGGTLFMVGSEDQPVSIGNIWGISFDHATGDLSFADIRMRNDLFVGSSRLVVANTTVSNRVGGIVSDGIKIRGSSDVAVFDSRIENNDTGIMIESSEPVFPVMGMSKHMAYAGDITNLALETARSNDNPIVVVNDSSLAGNTKAAIDNRSQSIVGAQSNWWGRIGGPVLLGPNQVIGNVLTDDWIDHDPTRLIETTCCSSVLFIPGLQASRLYRDTPRAFGLGMTTNTLWEPNRNDDVKKLFLDDSGTSTTAGIYAGRPIESAFGIVPIYSTFLKSLDTLARAGTIREWKSFGYDWRKPVAEVVAGREQRATTTESLVEIVENLAVHSKTGKVSIVAHSYGGLVTAGLVKYLTDHGSQALIDTVVSVAVPTLGTPQALAALLHGYDQGIGGGSITTAATMRDFGKNMASAYSLLPSVEYFKSIIGPTIVFASTTITGINDGSYTKEIDSHQMQSDFMQDSARVRNSDPGSNTKLPIRGNAALIAAADIIHGMLDPFSWPATIAHWAIIGWGNKTTSGLTYSEKKSKPIVDINTTNMGDGTVVAQSAAYKADEVVSVDINKQGQVEHKSIVHSNILESHSTQKTLTDILSSDTSKSRVDLKEKISKIPYVTLGPPDYSKEQAYTVLSTHSPVELHVYDAEGRHTGIKPTPAGLDIEEGFITFFDKEIPGSDFKLFESEGDPETTISLPDDSDQTYRVEIKGLGIGTFTYQVGRERGSTKLDNLEFEDMPVTPLMIAHTNITTNKPGISPTSSLVSTTPPIRLDFDGDGSIDFVATSSVSTSQLVQLEAIRTMILGLSDTSPRSKSMSKKIDKIIDLYKKGKLNKVRDQSEKLLQKLVHKKGKKPSSAEKNQIYEMIELFLSQYE